MSDTERLSTIYHTLMVDAAKAKQEERDRLEVPSLQYLQEVEAQVKFLEARLDGFEQRLNTLFDRIETLRRLG